MEYEFNDVEYDTGYGVQAGTLVVECEAIQEDMSFDHEFGRSGGWEVTGVKDVSATLFLIGNNGVELGEVVFTQDELFEQYPYLEETLIEKLSEDIFNQ